MPGELTIRPYVAGQDEAALLEITNQVNAEFPDSTPLTRAEFEAEQNSPGYDREGRFVAEWNGHPVALVHAFVDPHDPKHEGFLNSPRVLSEFRRRHIGTALIQKAFASFRERAVSIVQASARDENVAAQRFLEKFGFQQCRVFSWMRRSLAELPQDVGESTTIVIRPLGFGTEDIVLINRLLNEAMKEHYHFRPSTLEETRYWFAHFAQLGVTMQPLVAYVQGNPVGILLTSLNRTEIAHLGKNRGGLDVLGVLKPYRRQGIGKALMLQGMKWLQENGMEEADLGVDDANPLKAIRIYQQLGFQVVRKFIRYEKELRRAGSDPLTARTCSGV